MFSPFQAAKIAWSRNPSRPGKFLLRSEALTEPRTRLKRLLKKEKKKIISTKKYYPVVLQIGSTIIRTSLQDNRGLNIYCFKKSPFLFGQLLQSLDVQRISGKLFLMIHLMKAGNKLKGHEHTWEFEEVSQKKLVVKALIQADQSARMLESVTEVVMTFERIP